MDILAYLLCHFLEIKDKPGNEFGGHARLSVLIQCHRTTRALSGDVLHYSDALSRTCLWPPAHVHHQICTYTCKVECRRRRGGFYDQRACNLPYRVLTSDSHLQTVYHIIATTSGSLNSMYPALIIALSNSAPYFKSLNVNSATRLLQLFNSFANPKFLLADEGHPRLLFFM